MLDFKITLTLIVHTWHRSELFRLEKEMQAKKEQLDKELVKSEERVKQKLEEEEEKYRQACEAAFRHSMEEFKKYGPQRIPRRDASFRAWDLCTC